MQIYSRFLKESEKLLSTPVDKLNHSVVLFLLALKDKIYLPNYVDFFTSFKLSLVSPLIFLIYNCLSGIFIIFFLMQIELLENIIFNLQRSKTYGILNSEISAQVW